MSSTPRDLESLTWAGLLAQWMDFARASLALPDGAEGDAWRASVVPIINLQAVTFALADLGKLPADERALARDKAEILIGENARALERAWGRTPMPELVLEIGNDARLALQRSEFAGAVELVWPGPGTMVMPPVEPSGDGTIAVMQPGTIVMPGEPVAWWVNRDTGVEVDGCVPRATQRPRQVYRQIDRDGRITGDVVAPIDTELAPGLPLLVPLFENGRELGHFTMQADAWLARQRESMVGETLPIELRE